MVVAAAVCLLAARPQNNPPLRAGETIGQRTKMPAEVTSLLERGCRDCHSNETKWPWYTRVPPASWMIGRDVERGRQAMNLSDWPASRPVRAAGTLMAACADVKTGRMPLRVYQIMHPESVWSEQEKRAFCEWTQVESQKLLGK